MDDKQSVEWRRVTSSKPTVSNGTWLTRLIDVIVTGVWTARHRISSNRTWNESFHTGGGRVRLSRFDNLTIQVSFWVHITWTSYNLSSHENIIHSVNIRIKTRDFRLITLRTSCGAVYCNRSCLFVCGCVGGAVTTITRNCVHRSSPNWFSR